MKVVFDIEGEIAETDAVLCEWGEAYCCVVALDSKRKAMGRLHYYSFEQQDSEVIETIINYAAGLGAAEGKLILCSAFPEALLVPKKLYRSGQNYLSALYESKTQPLADHIGEWQVVNTYIFPEPIQSTIAKRFPSAHFYHAYTPMLKVYNGFDASSQIVVHFSPNLFRVVVKKGGQVQLAQMYHYKTALDVVYYLLKMMEELALPKEETAVIISGFVEEGSGLYKELHQFILNLHFAQSNTIQLETDLPAHYFTSLYNLAACVL